MFRFSLLIAASLILRLQWPALLHLGQKLHHSALGFIHSNPSPWDWLLSALVIGHDEGLRKIPQGQVFIVLGLYHVLVVSGGHIFLIERLLRPLGKIINAHLHQLILWSVLFLFLAVNRFQPACLRSTVQILVSNLFYLTLRRTPFPVIISAGVCIFISPVFLTSLSFQLSFVASTALALSRILCHSGFSQCFCMIFLMSPCLLGMQECLSWLVFPANIFLLPLMEWGLIPLSFLAFGFPVLKGYASSLVLWSLDKARWISEFKKPQLCMPASQWQGFAFIYALLIWLILWRVHQNRERLKFLCDQRSALPIIDDSD
jgi:ComEC/Rec2-related protein